MDEINNAHFRNCKSREVGKRSNVFNIQQNDFKMNEKEISPSPVKPRMSIPAKD
jgi:hypothetical protein